MASSANDVWGAVFVATNMYPEAMPDQITAIRVTNRDGVTAGSIREITYGKEIKRMVARATEEITRVDHEHRTIESRFNNDREFVGKIFRSASLVIKVDPNSFDNGPSSRGCTITWTLTYSGFKDNLNFKMFQDAIGRGFASLDTYLTN
ncbi:unnamed protein product [Linum tenue]|uniref:Bet v I/Major latex protein domain-containing protein n=1 Tax=Linum tenue TaxID=586396 RepID=A0AAV0L682_9ROSI|nr:unnamed protein product [Linum tenue]